MCSITSHVIDLDHRVRLISKPDGTATACRCTACGHKEGLAVQEVQAALARSQPRRRRRRALSCGFRSQCAAANPVACHVPLRRCRRWSQTLILYHWT